MHLLTFGGGMVSSQSKGIIVLAFGLAVMLWSLSSSGVPSLFLVQKSGLGGLIRSMAAEHQMSVDDYLESLVMNSKASPKSRCPDAPRAGVVAASPSGVFSKEVNETFRPVLIPRYRTPSVLAKRSYSQCAQDAVVLGLLETREKKQRYFVDLACNHAYKLSNSYLLEAHYGWKGICADANYQYWYELAKYRTCEIVGGAFSSGSGDEVSFAFRGIYGGIVGAGLDNTGGGVPTPTITFDKVLESLKFPRVIDYLSLDVEGAESMVFQGIDMSVTKFAIISIERPKPDLRKLLTDHGYELVFDLGWFGETLWLNKEMFPNWQEVKSAGQKKVAIDVPNAHFSSDTFCKDPVVSNCA